MKKTPAEQRHSAEAPSTAAEAEAAGTTEQRRDFLFLLTGAMGALGTAAALWPLIDSMNPSADVRALSTVSVDLAPIDRGQRITVMWTGRPVFIAHRTDREIARSEADDRNPNLVDPATDASRVTRKEWLIVIGICTHLGCVPLGQRPTDPHGEYGGWFCPCHGSVYDTAGRIRHGPAPRNLDLPAYAFEGEARVKLG